MGEGLAHKEPVPTDRQIEKENPFAVKESWFNAYVEANVTFPQNSTYIRPRLALAVLQDPPKDWRTFSGTDFSDTQLQRLGEMMSRSHAKKGLNTTTRDNMHYFSDNRVHLVSEDRMRGLWKDARDDLLANLSVFFGSEYNGKSLHDGMHAFLGDPQNAEDIRKVIAALKQICKAFQGKEAQAWLANYRKGLILSRKGTYLLPEPIQLEESVGYFKVHILREELKNLGIDPHEKFFSDLLVSFEMTSGE